MNDDMNRNSKLPRWQYQGSNCARKFKKVSHGSKFARGPNMPETLGVLLYPTYSGGPTVPRVSKGSKCARGPTMPESPGVLMCPNYPGGPIVPKVSRGSNCAKSLSGVQVCQGSYCARRSRGSSVPEGPGVLVCQGS